MLRENPRWGEQREHRRFARSRRHLDDDLPADAILDITDSFDDDVRQVLQLGTGPEGLSHGVCLSNR
jgi:hypothetical protein